jgi:hypothetical protein
MLQKRLTKAVHLVVAVTAALVLGNAAQAQPVSPSTSGAGTNDAGATGASPPASAPADPGVAGSRMPNSDKSKNSKTTSPSEAAKEADKNMPKSTPEQTNLNRSTGEGNMTGPNPVTGTESGTGKPGSTGTSGSKAN